MLQVELVSAWLDGEAEGSVGSVSVTDGPSLIAGQQSRGAWPLAAPC
jgi:hypothetical protein